MRTIHGILAAKSTHTGFGKNLPELITGDVRQNTLFQQLFWLESPASTGQVIFIPLLRNRDFANYLLPEEVSWPANAYRYGPRWPGDIATAK